MLGLTIVLLAFFPTYGLSRLIVRDDSDLSVLLSPALLVVIWTFLVSDLVEHEIPLKNLWLPFWITAIAATVVGVVLAFRDGWRFKRSTFIVPIGATSVLMAPYLVNGIGTFPGSWFWDGFAYTAAGESLWLYPRHANIPGLELYYQFGHRYAQLRYVSMAIGSILKGAYPFGGDAQAATGYFLFLCVLTFSSSCYFLAKTAMPRRRTHQIVFVIVATVSSPILNLVWVNNFDHLLAMSISPTVIGLSFALRWNRKSDAFVLGAFVAALVYIYPEMVAFLTLPAACILLVRMFREPGRVYQIQTATIGIITSLILVFPASASLWSFMTHQIHIGMNTTPGIPRPGEGYFPTYFTFACSPGAWLGMFTPFLTCDGSFTSLVKSLLGVAAMTVLIISFMSWRRTLALLIAATTFVLLIGYFLIHQHYDYGAFKMLETAWVPLLLVCVIGTMDLNRKMSAAAAIVAIAIVGVAAWRIAAFNRWTPTKSINQYAGLEYAVPPAASIEVKIQNQLAFEWATYYLRNHKVKYAEGELLYFPASRVEKSRGNEPDYLVTDKPLDSKATWTNGTYFLYPYKAAD